MGFYICCTNVKTENTLMSDINQRIKVFDELGSFLRQFASETPPGHHLNNTFLAPMEDAIARSKAENGWFTVENIHKALNAWGLALSEENLKNWVSRYNFSEPSLPKKVAVIMAGNIPLVGFHDFLTVLLFGHKVQAKLSSDDKRLLPVIAKMITEMDPELGQRIAFVEKVENPDAVIATGSNNTARYFEYYFGKYPNIIRKNRTSVAVLSGDESDEQLRAFGEDLFRYFGLGCRNVSKLYLPKGFDLDRIFGAIVSYNDVVNNNKYANNYDYYRAIYMLNKHPFLENGFVIFREQQSLHTPVAVVHYEFYEDENVLRQQLDAQRHDLQCIVSNSAGDIPFGQTQQPALWDYADGVDTAEFLLDLN